MRTFFALFAILILAITVTCSGQTAKDYYVKWSPNPAADSVLYYEVYLQTQTNNTGWALEDGAEYSTGIQTYFKVNIPHVIGKTTDYVYTVNLPLSGGWAVAGIIANNGIRSVLATSTSNKIGKKPGKPSNVRIEDNP